MYTSLNLALAKYFVLHRILQKVFIVMEMTSLRDYFLIVSLSTFIHGYLLLFIIHQLYSIYVALVSGWIFFSVKIKERTFWLFIES